MAVSDKLKSFPFEIYGRIYAGLNLEHLTRRFLPEPYHIRVICYHDIPKQNLHSFDKQIAFFKREFSVINAQQLKDFFLGKECLHRTNVFITFDDGSADQYRAADVLDKHNIQACFFVNTSDRDKKFINARPGTKLPPMTWEQIKNLHRRGHIIGSHTATHPNLSRLQASEIAKELLDSKKSLEDAVGAKVDFFSFPYGTLKEVSREALLIAQRFYDFNFLFVPGKSEFATANRFLINRTGVSPRDSLYYLQAVMAGLRDWRKKKERETLRQLLFSV